MHEVWVWLGHHPWVGVSGGVTLALLLVRSLLGQTLGWLGRICWGLAILASIVWCARCTLHAFDHRSLQALSGSVLAGLVGLVLLDDLLTTPEQRLRGWLR